MLFSEIFLDNAHIGQFPTEAEIVLITDIKGFSTGADNRYLA
jgi:hypothetical protein